MLAGIRSARAAVTHQKIAALSFLVLLGLTFLIYLPGLNGGFLLDDYQNLRGLAEIQESPSFENFASFVLTGIGGSLGRPVALLSFAPQYFYWPVDAASFKYVNLLLHLLNGCLLCWLLVRLGNLLGYTEKQTLMTALIATAVWLLHPIQVSTVFYVIQRMTELCALFTFLGLLAYLHGREQLLKGRREFGYLWLSSGVVLGTFLATLSKENGVLLVVYVAVMEITLLQSLPKPPYWRVWCGLFIYLPLVLLAGYFLGNMEKLLVGYQLRDFNLTERLLTESRILVDYILKMIFPSLRSFNLLFDDYPVSRGLLAPPTTLFSILIICGLLGAALKYRRRAPMFAFAVLWFFGGHVMESTVLPLELYYEHRNYLPMVGLVFAGGHYAVRLPQLMPGRLRQLIICAGLVLLALFAAITWNESRLWGDPYRQAVTWAAERPLSTRAQEYLAGVWMVEKKNDEALKVFKRLTVLHPHDAGGFMHWMKLACTDDDLPLPNMLAVVDGLKTSEYSTVPVGSLEEIVQLREKNQNQCQRIKYTDLQQCFDSLLANPRYGLARNNLYTLQARLFATEGLLDPAMEAMDKANAIEPTIGFTLLQAKWLVSAGLYADALRYVAKARAVNDRKLLTRWLHEGAIDSWEQAVLEAQKASQAKAPGGADRE